MGLDPQLQHDTVPVVELGLSRVLLMKNASFPWVILVPKPDNLVELIDLTQEQRYCLFDEIAQISEVMKLLFAPDKLNVAALGNVVRQLHIHVIARYKTDAAWPNPVWGNGKISAYEPETLRTTIALLQKALT